MANNERISKDNPFRKFQFKVERKKDSSSGWKEFGGFQKVSGLKVQTEPKTYEEGGVNRFVHQLPGQVKYSNVTLERGLTVGTKLWDWINDVRGAVGAQKTSMHEARMQVRIKLMDGFHPQGKGQSWEWKLTNAYPVKWEGPSMSADTSGGSGSIAVQKLELNYDFFSTSGPER